MIFDGLAGTYDLANAVLSLGLDSSWRRRAVTLAAPAAGESVLDVACGTGALTAALARMAPGSAVAGVDLSEPMLSIARRRAAQAGGLPVYIRANALALPFAAGSQDLVTIAFGLRNLRPRAAALAELARVLRPGGRLMVLEFSPPPGGLWGLGLRAWLAGPVPLLGGLISGRIAPYRYLVRSILAFPTPEALSIELAGCGFDRIAHRRLRPGLVAVHTAVRTGGRTVV